MIILIDAYNVIKQTSSTGHISEQQRAAFIKKLIQYAREREHRIIVVFDGGETYESYSSGPVRVVYSGHETNADTILKKLCAQLKREQVMLVSSDREICSYASLYRIPCIEATALYELLNHAQQEQPTLSLEKQKGAALKQSGYESSEDIDALMQEAAQFMLIKHEDNAQRSRKPAAKTDSKSEKKIKKLVGKL